MMLVAQLTGGEARREHKTLADGIRSKDRCFIRPNCSESEKTPQFFARECLLKMFNIFFSFLFFFTVFL